MMIIKRKSHDKTPAGFTLVEVVLAIGVLGLAVLALLGMFAPTLNNISSVIESDFAISSTGHITNYLERKASDEFDEIVKLATSSSVSDAGNIKLYSYIRVDNGKEELFVTDNSSEVTTDLKKDNVLGVVLRAQFYQVPAENNYDYGQVSDAFYIPFIIKLFAVQPNNPQGAGTFIMEYPIAVTR